MTIALHIPQIAPETNDALNAVALQDGVDAARLVEAAIERELRRIETRRKLIARHKHRKVFALLRPSLSEER